MLELTYLVLTVNIASPSGNVLHMLSECIPAALRACCLALLRRPSQTQRCLHCSVLSISGRVAGTRDAAAAPTSWQSRLQGYSLCGSHALKETDGLCLSVGHSI